jgi:hypothetical protein
MNERPERTPASNESKNGSTKQGKRKKAVSEPHLVTGNKDSSPTRISGVGRPVARVTRPLLIFVEEAVRQTALEDKPGTTAHRRSGQWENVTSA